MRAGALNVRVTTSSRSEFRSTVVPLSLSFFAAIVFFLLFQFLDNLVELVEARGPELAVRLDPCGFFRQSARAELAGAHAPDLLGRDEPRLLQDAAPGGVRERGERGIEACGVILNHMVQYIPYGVAACKIGFSILIWTNK